MPRQHYGPEAKKQTKRLLEALVAYANHELENCDSEGASQKHRLQIKFNWKTDNELVVETKVRFLEELMAKAQPDGKLKKEQIKEALHRLEKFLEILEDNRATKQGAEDWHFRLKLWHKRHDKEANLRQFDIEWERRRGDLPLEAMPEIPPPQKATDRSLKSAIAPFAAVPEAIATEIPEGPVALNSIFYVDRPPIESRSCETITQAGALIRIKAPRQMGKTSLLDRIVDRAAKEGYRTVRLNLLQAEGAVFSRLDKFLRWFCACVSHKLQLPAQLSNYWDEDRGSIVNCTTYFEVHLLEQIDAPLVLALDEVDRVFQSAEIAQGFFPMLRSWHEEAKTIDIWEKLRLVVVHSTEDYGPLDINQSPFNVGLPVELTEFIPEQVKDLAQRHKLDWNDIQVQQLMAMVGGHPYLVRLALYNLACQDLMLDKLLQEAPTEAGIYEEHLRRHWGTLIENLELAAALKQVVTAIEPVRLETMQAYKLYSMGLIKRIGDRVIPRCQLYQQYFRERLRN
jgi:hypothetical protein